MPTVAIVDDHRLLAETLRATLAERGIEAVAVPTIERSAMLTELLSLHAALVLLDLDLGPAGDGTELVAPLVRAGIKVLVVTGVIERVRVALALEQGALGYQSKTEGFDALLAATAVALVATAPLDPAGRRQLLGELAVWRAEQARGNKPFTRLTERERDVLSALADGHSVTDIAHDWVVSDATVRTHVRGLLGKLGVRSQLGAVALALRNGWLAGRGGSAGPG